MDKSKKKRSITSKYRHKLRYIILKLRSASLVDHVKNALTKCSDTIPVFVVSYNNGVYVKNITQQLNNFSVTPIISDNNSYCKNTQRVLNELSHSGMAQIARSNYNFGHLVGFIEPFYLILPEVFAYTDPDLQFNDKLPGDFMIQLADLTTLIPVFKAGFALSLNIKGTLKNTKIHLRNSKPFLFEKQYSIKDYESKYWIKRLQHEKLEIYAAPIDTTFAVYRKQNYCGDFHDAIRVAGDYSATHLPWFVEFDLFSEDDRAVYNKQNISSNW